MAVGLADFSPANMKQERPSSVDRIRAMRPENAAPSPRSSIPSPSPSGSTRMLGRPPRPGVGMADEDESEVEVNPIQPSRTGQIVRKVLNHLRKVGDNPTNAGVAVGYGKLLTPRDGLNVNARQPVDPNKPPRASGGPRAPQPPWWEQVPGEHPALIRKKSEPSKEYLRTIYHPDLPKMVEEYTHGINGPKLTDEEVQELMAHFLSDTSSGIKPTKPHLNKEGKPTKAEDRYPNGVHKITRWFGRVGYDPEKLMPNVEHRNIDLENIHMIAPYTSKNVGHPETIQWIDTKPEGKIGTSNKPNSGHRNMKTVHQRIVELCHSPIEATGMSNCEGGNIEMAGGNQRRSWRSYAYRKLGLPKFGLSGESELPTKELVGQLRHFDRSASRTSGQGERYEAIRRQVDKLADEAIRRGIPIDELTLVPRGTSQVQTDNEETDEHEDLKNQYTPHELAEIGLKLKDSDPKASLGFYQIAGDLAGEVGGVGMSDSTGMPKVPGAPAEPKAPSTSGLGKIPGKVAGAVGSQVGRAVIGAGIQGVANQTKKLGALLSNDLTLSNTPSSHRITRSPGNQILFELRQKKGR